MPGSVRQPACRCTHHPRRRELNPTKAIRLQALSPTRSREEIETGDAVTRPGEPIRSPLALMPFTKDP